MIKPNLSVAFLFFCAIANLAIGLYIFSRKPLSAMHRAFCSYAIPISVWAFALGLAHGSDTSSPYYFRLAFSAGSLVPIAMLHFAYRFPGLDRAPSFVASWLFTPAGLMFALLSWSPWIVRTVEVEASGVRAIYGPLHLPFALYVVACFALGNAVLYRTYRQATGLLRLQTRYLLLALSLPAALAVVTNVVTPLILATSTPGRYGPLFSLLMVTLVAHSIIRHRLMDIRVVIKQGVVYLAAFAVAGAALLLLLVASNLIFPDEHWFTALEILLALTIAVLFHPLKTRIQRAFDHYLYREPYDYPRVIRQTSEALNGTIELVALLDCVGGVIRNTLKPEGLTVYLLEETDVRFECAWTDDFHRFPEILAPDSPLPSRATSARALVFRDELTSRDPDSQIAREMDRLGVDVVAPLLEEGQLFGLIAIGPKRSGNPYFTETPISCRRSRTSPLWRSGTPRFTNGYCRSMRSSARRWRPSRTASSSWGTEGVSRCSTGPRSS